MLLDVQQPIQVQYWGSIGAVRTLSLVLLQELFVCYLGTDATVNHTV